MTDYLLGWLNKIQSLHSTNIDLSLERTIEVARRLDVLHPTRPVVTVAGTNGKGSTVAGIESIMLAAGFRVGAFTTPFLFVYNEQVRINGESIDDDALCEAFKQVDAARGDITLTPFEFGALAAFVIFKQSHLDLWILEVGMGGRFDAVNAIDGDIAVVTSIAIDHAEWLGDTREKIAYEKAGIFRKNKPVIYGDLDPPQSLIDYAEKIQAPVFFQGKQFGWTKKKNSWDWHSEKNTLEHLSTPPLFLQNMSAVLMAIELLQERLPVSRDAIDKGLKNIHLPGRIQYMLGGITRIADVSHNPAAIAHLAEHLHQHPISGKTIAVFSMLSDKDIIGSIEAIKDEIEEWHVAPLDDARAACLEKLKNCFNRTGIKDVYFYDALHGAEKEAIKRIKSQDRLVIFGSFKTVAVCGRSIEEVAGMGDR